MPIKFGDLSIVYPIARGLAPVLIAIGAYFWVGEVLPNAALVGILIISVGIMTLTYGISHSSTPMIGIVAAVGTAITIALYSIVDGVGVRLSGSIMGYVGWLFIAEIIVAAYRIRQVLGAVYESYQSKRSGLAFWAA